MSAYLTVDDMRQYAMDRSVEDNEMFMDLAYTDEEIASCIAAAAREYNSIPPFVIGADAACLPTNTNMFFDAALMHMMMRERVKLIKGDIDYQAGGAPANLVRKRIEHLNKLIPEYEARFKKAATDQKVFINLRGAYGPVG